MQAVKDYGATLIYAYRTLRGIVIRPPQNVPLQDAAAHFEQVKGVLTVNQDNTALLNNPCGTQLACNRPKLKRPSEKQDSAFSDGLLSYYH